MTTTTTTTKHTYSDADARRSVRRHEQRSVEERLTFLREILINAANDRTPTYEGEENGRPYKGEPVWQWAIKTLAYHAASAHSPLNGEITDYIKGCIKWAASDGIRMAGEHNRSSRSLAGGK